MTADHTANDTRVQEIVELVKRLCLALVNVEMFTANHPLAKDNITNAYAWLRQILDRDKRAVVISVAGASVVLDGMTLENRNTSVSKLASRLNDIHAKHLSFETELTEAEFVAFYGILGLGSRVINERGGLPTLLADRKIAGIKLRDVNYVMLTEDERVVRRDAKVADDPVASGDTGAELTRYMVGEVMKREEEQKWLLSEVKNNPARVADLIAEGINLAVSRAGTSSTDGKDSVADLIENIRHVCDQLNNESDSETGQTPQELETAVMTLERELRSRRSQMTDSKVAGGFLNEILAIVANYADQVRAKKIASSFVKGEKGLESAERLLRRLAPKIDSPDAYLIRISELVKQRGIAPEEIEALVSKVKKRSQRPKVQKKKSMNQTVMDGIQRRLEALNLEDGQIESVKEDLAAFIENRAKERAGLLREDAGALKLNVERRNQVLDRLPNGVVLWDVDGTVQFANKAATTMLGAAPALSDGLRGALEAESPLSTDAHAALADAERNLCARVVALLRDDAGEIFGAILKPADI
jgi:PAS domain-containing protein